jgi:putative ABC transport system substrate-binding protein
MPEIARLAIAQRIATSWGVPDGVRAGGLFAIGPEQADLYRRTADYIDKIIKGAKPGDLPVEQPQKLELIINMKTAQAIGLTIPPSVLAQATEVIQ